MITTKEEQVEHILFCLNKNKIRATYGAVAKIVGVGNQGIGRYLGANRSYASWIVSKGTCVPSGYEKEQYHHDLFLNDIVIDSDVELMRLMLCD